MTGNRQSYLLIQDLLMQFLAVLVSERRVARYHLVDERTKRPPIYRLIVRFATDHLRWHVL